MYLCNVCSGPYILRRNGHGQPPAHLQGLSAEVAALQHRLGELAKQLPGPSRSPSPSPVLAPEPSMDHNNRLHPRLATISPRSPSPLPIRLESVVDAAMLAFGLSSNSNSVTEKWDEFHKRIRSLSPTSSVEGHSPLARIAKPRKARQLPINQSGEWRQLP
jgi:hypothetical protein